jgi:tRNA pseudouridine55 synthase
MIDLNGFLLVDKPDGISSFGVVGRIRWALTQMAGKKVKVGHTGTLDPFATGLLVLVIGDYCKRAGEFSKLDKTYKATMHLGWTSSTGDPEGELTEVSNSVPTKTELQSALTKFVGSITQTPPIYSAIKINGQRAYKLARQGQQVEVPPRTVMIKKLDLLSYIYPNAEIVCEVGSGTYIRTLVEDIGKELGTGAYCTELRRTKVDRWNVDQALSMEDESYESKILEYIKSDAIGEG